MKAENLVKKKELLEQLCTYKGKRKKPSVCLAYHKLVDSCTLSPAELAGILPEIRQASLKGDSWVLEEFKKEVKNGKYTIHPAEISTLLKWIQDLESRAPVSELAEQAKEDRRKAEAWDMLENYLLDREERFVVDGVDTRPSVRCEAIKTLKEMDELLARSKLPPKAEEEK